MNFWLPVGVLALLGIVFSEETKDSRMMNRQQTDEWKGNSFVYGIDILDWLEYVVMMLMIF